MSLVHKKPFFSEMFIAGKTIDISFTLEFKCKSALRSNMYVCVS